MKALLYSSFTDSLFIQIVFILLAGYGERSKGKQRASVISDQIARIKPRVHILLTIVCILIDLFLVL